MLCPSSNSSQLPSMIQRISPLQRHHYITSNYTYQFLKKVIFVPHYSIALHLSSLEWGIFRIVTAVATPPLLV